MNTNLDDLRKEIAEDAAKKAEEQTDELDLSVDEPEEAAEPETEEPQAELEDFDLELEDGEPDPDQQKKHTAEQALYHKLTKQKKKRQEAESEVESLRAELNQLKAAITQPAQPEQDPQSGLPPVPVLYENGVNTPQEYTVAYQNWVNEVNQINAQKAQREASRNAVIKQTQAKADSLAKKASGFIQENNLKPDLVIDAIETATSEISAATGLDDALVVMLDAVGEGAERVAYHLGRNQTSMSKVKQLLSEDPSGMRAISFMTRLTTKLKPKTQVSKAPEIDEPVKGDGSTQGAKKLQALYDKASDPQEMMRLRKKARELGVKLA